MNKYSKLKLSFNASAKQYAFPNIIANMIQNGMEKDLKARESDRQYIPYGDGHGMHSNLHVDFEFERELSLMDVQNVSKSIVDNLNTMLDGTKNPQKIHYKVSGNSQEEQFEMSVKILPLNEPA